MAENKDQGAFQITREARGRVRGNGIELAFGYWPGRGAPVVALHGLTASFVNFIGVAERLAGRRPLFGLDLRGRGDSEKPEGPYGLAQHARDVAEAMRAMGLGPSVILGHSMGAYVAAALAAQAPELVSGLMLIDGGYVADLKGDPKAAEGINALLTLRIVQLRQTYTSREAYRAFWKSQPHFPPSEWSQWVEAFLDYEIGGEPPNFKPKACEAGVRVDLAEGLKRAEITARLEATHVPVLMLRAESGFGPGQPPLFPNAMITEMRSYVPQMEEHLIPGTTHYTILLGHDGATRIADMLVDFAKRCEGLKKSA